MPTPTQIRVIQMAKRAVGLTDPAYRTLLRNVADVESSKSLINAGVEDVLAVLEDLGFQSHPAGPNYWRRKVVRRGQCCNERMIWKIEALAAEQRYQLPALCLRMSNRRTDQVGLLYPKEAYNLIEALKAIVDRPGTERTETTEDPEPVCQIPEDDVPF